MNSSYMPAVLCVRSCNFRVYERYKVRTQLPGNKRKLHNALKSLQRAKSQIYDLADYSFHLR